MGKGDQKSRRGKIAIGSYGVTRLRSDNKVTVKKVVAEAAPVAEVTKPAKKKKTA